jgi:3-oxoadipate enol-lactonase
MSAAIEERFADTRHGRIHYLQAGDGEPLVLLHSNGCSAWEYEFVLPGLARTRRVIAMDMPGHGDSDRIVRHYSMEMYADSVIGLLDALGIRRAAVSGASIGGTICLALGRDHAARVHPAVIVEAPLRTGAQWAQMWPRIEASYAEPTQTEAVLKPRFRAVTSELLSRWNTDRNKAGAWTMVDVMRAMRDFDALAALAAQAGPSAAIIGEVGTAAPNRGEYERHLGAARVVVLADCGHFPMIDDPAAFVAAHERLLAATG